jgi:hypothetical protein
MNDQHTWHVSSVKLSEIAESMAFAGMTTSVIASEKSFQKFARTSHRLATLNRKKMELMADNGV